MTPAFKLFIAIKSAGIDLPAFEHRFHAKRRWRFDLAWPALKIAVECHGATFRQGRHTRGKGFSRDREKMNEAQILGWIVLEFGTDQLERPFECVEVIRRAIAARSDVGK